MPPMRLIGLTALAISTSLAAGGCVPKPAGEQKDPETEISSLRMEIRELKAQLASQKDKNA